MQIFHNIFQLILGKLYEIDDWLSDHFTEFLSSLFSLFSFKIIGQLDTNTSFLSRNASDIEKEYVHTFFAVLTLCIGWLGGWIFKKIFTKVDRWLDEKFK